MSVRLFLVFLFNKQNVFVTSRPQALLVSLVVSSCLYKCMHFLVVFARNQASYPARAQFRVISSFSINYVETWGFAWCGKHVCLFRMFSWRAEAMKTARYFFAWFNAARDRL